MLPSLSLKYNPNSNDVSFIINNLPVGELVRLKFDNLNIIDDFEIESDSGNVFGYSLIIDNSTSLVSGRIIPKYEGLKTDYLSLSVLIEVQSDQGFNVVSVAASGCDIQSKVDNYYIGEIPDITIDRDFVNIDEVSKIKIISTPNIFLDFKVNDKLFKVKTNSSGAGFLSLSPVQFCDSHQINSNQVLRFPIQYKIESSKNYISTGKKIHFIPDKIKALQSTNSDGVPDCIIVDPNAEPQFIFKFESFDKPGYDGPIVGPIYDTSGAEAFASSTILDEYEHAKNGNIKALSSSLLGGLNSSFISSDISISKARHIEGSALSSSVRFAFSAVDGSANFPEPENDNLGDLDGIQFPNNASRVVVGEAYEGQSFVTLGVNRGMIIKPSTYYHSVLLDSSAFAGDVFSILVRFSDGSFVEKTYVLKTSSILIEAEEFIEELNLDADFISRGVSSFMVSGRIEMTSDNAFTIIKAETQSESNRVNSISLNSNATIDLFVTKTDNDEVFSDSSSILFFDDRFRGVKFDIISYESSIVKFSLYPGYNRIGGFNINDFVYCLDFVVVTPDDVVDHDSLTSESLPYIMSGGHPISAIEPQISSSGRVVCSASVNDKLQLFLYTPDNAEPWTQLTSVGENKNPKIVEDTSDNIHIVWESDRGGKVQLYYTCIGVSSRMFSNLAIDNLLARAAESNSDINYLNLSLNPDLEFVSEGSYSVLERDLSSQQILLSGYLESDDGAYIMQEFIGPSPVEFSRVEVESVDSDHLFNNNENVLFDGVGGFDGFNKGDFISSMYVHIDPIGPSSYDDSSWQDQGSRKTITFRFKSDYKIVGASYTQNELNASDSLFAPSRYKYEESRSIDNLLYKINFDEDMKGFTASVSFNLVELNHMVAGIRVYLSIPYSDASSTYSGEWHRLASQDGRCSIVGSDSVVADFNPIKSSAAAVSILNKNEYGDFFDGLYSQLNYQVGFNLNMSLSSRKYEPIKDKSMGADIFNVINRVVDFSLDPPVPTSSEKIIVYNEFFGKIESHIEEKDSSNFIHKGSSLLNISGSEVYFPGINFGDKIISCYVYLRPESNNSEFNAQVEFNSKILDVIWESDDLINTDILVSNDNLQYGIDNRGLDSVDGTYNIGIDNSLTSMSIKASFIDVEEGEFPSPAIGFRVILDGSAVEENFYRKNPAQIMAMYREFKSKFTNWSVDVFEKLDNRYNINHTESKFDGLIPIFGSMKFDALSSNPLSEESTGIYSNQKIQLISNSIDDRTIQSIGTSSGTEQYYDISSDFKIDRSQTPLYHYLICLIPEVEYFSATNTETFSEYCSRTSQNPSICSNYIPTISESVYTGEFRLGVLASTSESLETNEQARKRYKLVYTTSRVFDLTVDKNIIVSANYIKQSNQSLNRISSYNKNIADDNEDMAELESDLRWMLDLQVLVNGKVGLSESFHVDMGDLRRQFDLSFGCPSFGDYISEEIIPFNGLGMSDIDLLLTYSNIKIGSNLIRFNNNIIDVDVSHRSLGSTSYLGYLGESFTNNDNFEFSIIDPYSVSSFGLGDYQPLPEGNSTIDGWDIINGGAIYLGSYYKAHSGNRSVLLESVDNNTIGDSSADYDSWTYSWSRNGYVGTGYGGGISQEIELVQDDKYFVRMVISCRPYSQESQASLFFDKKIRVSINGISREYSAPQFYGSFLGLETDDYMYKVIVFDFTSIGVDLIEIENVTEIPIDDGDYETYRGGIIVDQVNIFSASNASYENEGMDEHSVFGLSLEEYENNFYVNAVEKIPQIPITFDGINKSHDLYLDDFGKLHLTWQSNRDGSWNIYYTSSRIVDLSFREEVAITNTLSSSLKPSVCVNNKGERLIAWHDSRDGEYQIYSAVSTSGDANYVNLCDYDRYLYANSLLPSLDSNDPYYYDPYSYFIDELSCKIKFDFTSSTDGIHRFKILFYEDRDKTILVRTISSTTNSSGWYVNDVPIMSSGYTMQLGQLYNIEYIVSHEDGLENKIYYVDSYVDSISNSSEDDIPVNDSMSNHISYMDSFDSLNLTGQDEELNFNLSVAVAKEYVGPALSSYPPKFENDFILSTFINNSFQESRMSLPHGEDRLRGFGLSENISSFIVHAQIANDIVGDDSVDIDVVIAFSEPILAIIPYSEELLNTDMVFGNSNIIYSSANNRGFLDNQYDYISLSSDMKKATISIGAKAGDISQLRIITGGVTSSSSFIGSTVFYCPYEQSSSCNAPISYTNTTSEDKDVSFRVTAFSDSSLKNVVLSQYSGYDGNNFKYGVNGVPSSGIRVSPGQTVSLSYDPSFMDERSLGWHKRMEQNKILSSDFDKDIDGWECLSVGASGYPQYSSNPDVTHETNSAGDGFLQSFLYLIYENTDDVLYWSAPSKYSGQKSQFMDGKIIVRLSHEIDGSSTSITPSSGRSYMDDIVLEDSGGVRISTSFSYSMDQPDGEFIRHEVALSSGQGWRSADDNLVDGELVSYDVIRNVLANLKNIYIRSEYFNKDIATSNSVFLDEFSLVSKSGDTIVSSNRYSNLLCGVPYYFKIDTIDNDIFENSVSSSSLFEGKFASIILAIDVTDNVTDDDLVKFKSFANQIVDSIESGEHQIMCGLTSWSSSLHPSVDPTFDYDQVRVAIDSLATTGTYSVYSEVIGEVTSMYGGVKDSVSLDDFHIVFLAKTGPFDDTYLSDAISNGELSGRYSTIAYADAADHNGETWEWLKLISDSTNGGCFEAPNATQLSALAPVIYNYLSSEIASNETSLGGQGILKSDIKNVICPCGQVGFESPRRLTDFSTWKCSGVGLDDIRVTNTKSVALNPSISSTSFGFFYMAWEDYRHSVYDYSLGGGSGNVDTNILPQIYGGLFNINELKVYGSSNGISDIQFVAYDDSGEVLQLLYPSFAPKIYTDDFQNIMIFARGTSDPSLVYSSVGTINKPSSDVPLLSRNLLDSTNLPDTLSKPRSLGDLQYETIRLTGDSVSYSTYLTSSEPLSVIDDCFITLDILGIPGTYAVRLKNENDIDWSDWLSISNDVSEIDGNDPSLELDAFRALFSAKFIDSDRFTVPWIASSGDGFKRICCEVLTFFGKTKAFCMDFYAIYKSLKYSIELFYDESFTDPLNSFNDYPIISSVKYSSQIKNEDLSSLAEGEVETPVDMYWGKLVFHDTDKLKKLKLAFDSGYFPDRFIQEDFISCFVYQQGTQVDTDIEVTGVSDGIYKIEFTVNKSDGVEYKDGLGVARINVSGQCSSDVLELSTKEERRILNTDLIEDVSIYNNQTLFIERYSEDDLYESFGDRDYYISSFYNSDGSIRNVQNIDPALNESTLGVVDFESLIDASDFVPSGGGGGGGGGEGGDDDEDDDGGGGGGVG
ncbi:hypothetical protein CL614_03020 [archaeon]|nr:hypothetical protein [archaeon]|tara:strand:- start:4458 stop:14465 length:10008 start_codon:yes stop_codon:yes gene_type:complete